MSEGLELAGVELLHGLAVALGVGLLMGIERERHQPRRSDVSLPAGVRSFALVALAGWLAGLLGVAVLVVAVLGVAGLALMAYWRTSVDDPGLTTEVALLLCCLIGALAVSRPVLSAGVGVVAVILLAAKGRLHRMSRELISDAELRDGLVLAASALVVLPLLPAVPVDPFGLINPAAIWRLVVLIMGIGALGHLALRAFGERGWALSGFFSGYVSSTAAVLSYARRARAEPERGRAAAEAALAANLASLSLFLPLLAAVSLDALQALWHSIAGAMLALLGVIGWLRWREGGRAAGGARVPEAGRMFRIGEAIVMSLVLSAVVITAGLLNRWFGGGAALMAALIAGSVEVHSATASLAQLHASGALAVMPLRWGLVAILLSSGAVKAGLAFSAGGRAYGMRMLAGLLAMVGGGLGGVWLAAD